MEPPWLRVISLSWFSTSAYIWDEHSRFCLTRWTVKLFTIIKLTTSELVFNAYRSLCDFTIILDYYYHLIYERNNNLWCEIILWRKYSPNLAGFQKELLISETLCNSIKKTLKILSSVEFPSLDSFNQLILKLSIISRTCHSSFSSVIITFKYQ